MNHGKRCRAIAAALAGLVAARAAEPEGPVIALPPMIVAESSKALPWLYARVGNQEYLSRSSIALTREFIQAQHRARQRLELLVPAEFLVRHDAASVTVLLPENAPRSADDAVAGDMVRARPELSDAARGTQLRFLPNLRVDDRDSIAFFAFLDRSFDGDRLKLLPDYVRLLLETRTPMLPAWAIEGIIGVCENVRWTENPMMAPPLTWGSAAETEALKRDAERPKVLLPLVDLLSPVAPAVPQAHPEYVALWRQQVRLFFRWALESKHSAREGYWKLVAQAAKEPVTEELFEACFGFGFSDLRDRLSDYVALAVHAPLEVETGRLRPLEKIEISPATPAQIARVRGEWERAQAAYVRQRHPEFLARYLTQARITWRRAYDEGQRDPHLLATQGLGELEAGDEAAALPLLESAMAAGVLRPRVHYEVARLRFRALDRGRAPDARFSFEAIEPVLSPLRVALAQVPALPEAYLLFLDLLLRCETPPSSTELDRATEAATLFRGRPALVYRAALLLGRHGRMLQARSALEAALPWVADEPTREAFRELLSKLPPAAAAARAATF